MKASVLILVYNEAANLPRCLESLSWCEDIVVIDSGSTDNSVEIAKSYGARILVRKFDNFANQRNYGIKNGELKHDWVLHLDADEVTPPEFIQALNDLSPKDNIISYYIPSKLMLGDKWLRHSGMYPTYQVRLGRNKRLRFIQHGHGQREDTPTGQIEYFPEPYLHYNFSHGLKRWFEKHVRYAEDEALEILKTNTVNEVAATGMSANKVARRRFFKKLAGKLPKTLRPLARFFYIYFLRRGFLDGKAGLQYALMISAYEAMISSFLIEKRSQK